MLDLFHLGNVLLFVLQGNIACTRFLLTSNVVIGSMLVFMLHVKLACVKFILPCNSVVGNVIVFVIEVVGFCWLLFSLQCYFCQCSFVCTRSKSIVC